MAGETEESDSGDPVQLLHPFYLDTEMSMAFAAALAGGVALQREEVERDKHESRAVRNLRGNLRLFGAFGPVAGRGGVTGEREVDDADVAAVESRFVRQHTEASIFIALYDELRRTGQIVDDPDPATLRPSEIISLEIGPAVAPLRRLVDQLSRLINLAAPERGASSGGNRGQKQGSRATGTRAVDGVRQLLNAIIEDLDSSGMIDVVVAQDEGPNVVLTLDKRFITNQALELLHTSRFTVIGKVTQVWPTDEEFVNTYRRSVISLVPAFVQSVAWQMFAVLGVLAKSIDPETAQREAQEVIGMPEDENNNRDVPGGDAAVSGDEVQLSPEAVTALSPILQGPAIQILPLAICA
ncbi:MAG: DUF6414 family protein [Solirubrobacteraceae bacterium]